MLSKLVRGMATAAFLAANAVAPASAQVAPYDASQDMGGVKPRTYMNGFLGKIAAHHYSHPSELDMQRIFRLAMHNALGPYSHIQPRTNSEWVQAVSNAVMKRMDPHSAYYTQEQFQTFVNKLNIVSGGVGVLLAMPEKQLIVQTAIDHTPAMAAGIKPYDEIIAINGTPTEGLSFQECIALMNGKVDEPLTLSLKRNEGEPFEITMKRKVYSQSLIYAEFLEGNIGYIRLRSFGSYASAAVKQSIEILRQQNPNLQGYILDLRKNSGGVTEEAEKTADLFLESGVISMKKSSRDTIESVTNATAGDITNNAPLVVLIDGGTASSSELVAGALQKNGRALILGQPSYGKGSEQTISPLLSLGIPESVQTGIALYTSSLYFGPDGISPQARGITPDILTDNAWAPNYPKESDLDHVIPNPDRNPAPAPKRECALAVHVRGPFDLVKSAYDFYSYAQKPIFADAQLLCAIETLTGRNLYTQMRVLSP